MLCHASYVVSVKLLLYVMLSSSVRIGVHVHKLVFCPQSFLIDLAVLSILSRFKLHASCSKLLHLFYCNFQIKVDNSSLISQIGSKWPAFFKFLQAQEKRGVRGGATPNFKQIRLNLYIVRKSSSHVVSSTPLWPVLRVLFTSIPIPWKKNQIPSALFCG